MVSVRRTIQACSLLALLGAVCATAARTSAFAASTASGSSPRICTHPPSAAGKTITFAGYGGTFEAAEDSAWLRPYEKLTGITIRDDPTSDESKLIAQVQSHQVSWDLVDSSPDFGLGPTTKYLDKINYKVVGRAGYTKKTAPPYRIGVIYYSSILAYNTTQTHGKIPQSWADFFNLKKFPGKRAILNNASSGNLDAALMGSGVPAKHLYPLNLRRAFRELNKIKKDLVFYSSEAQGEQLVSSGEVSMALLSNGRAYDARVNNHAPVAIQWNQQIPQQDVWVIPKGTPNKSLAMNFLAWVTCAKNEGKVSRYLSYGPVNSLAKPYPGTKKYLPTSHFNKNTDFYNDKWNNAHQSAVTKAFEKWMLG